MASGFYNVPKAVNEPVKIVLNLIVRNGMSY